MEASMRDVTPQEADRAITEYRASGANELEEAIDLYEAWREVMPADAAHALAVAEFITFGGPAPREEAGAGRIRRGHRRLPRGRR
jgi:hypothetical protein